MEGAAATTAVGDTAGNSVKSTSKDVPPLDGTPRSTRSCVATPFHAEECLKGGILRADLCI